MKEETVKVLFVLIVYLLYMVIGALIFSVLELEHEKQQRKYYENLLKDVQRENNLSIAAMAILRKAHVEACEVGFLGSEDEPYKWDFAGSFYFVGTLITTIGFGMTSPVTINGQIAFIVYGLLGIPLNILLFNLALERTVIGTTMGIQYFKKKFPRSEQSFEDGVNNIQLHYIFFVAFGAFALVWIVSALVFANIEDWTFFEAFYFVLVTLTTVGFGDYVPSSRPGASTNRAHAHGYRIGNWLLIIFGLFFMYPVLNLAAGLLKKVLAGIFDTIKERTSKTSQVIPLADTPSLTLTTAGKALRANGNNNAGNKINSPVIVIDTECELDNVSVNSLRSQRSQKSGRTARHNAADVGSIAAIENSLATSNQKCLYSAEMSALLSQEEKLKNNYLKALEELEKKKLQLAMISGAASSVSRACLRTDSEGTLIDFNKQPSLS